MVGVVLAIAHASRGKEIYYFIIMLCKIKNEMYDFFFFLAANGDTLTKVINR